MNVESKAQCIRKQGKVKNLRTQEPPWLPHERFELLASRARQKATGRPCACTRGGIGIYDKLF